jgi:hypothetical protein
VLAIVGAPSMKVAIMPNLKVRPIDEAMVELVTISNHHF